MTKRFLSLILWHLISAIAYFVGAAIILTIVNEVANLFAFGGDAGWFTTINSVTLAFGILSFVAYLIFGGFFCKFEDYHNSSNDAPTVWSSRMNANNPLHYKTAQKQCIPYIILALIIVAARGVLWKTVNDFIYNGLAEKYSSPDDADTLETFVQIIFGLISCYFSIMLASVIKLPILCKAYACPSCGNMCSYEYDSKAGEEVVTTTKQKVGKESGHVYGSHTTVTTTPKCKVRCHYCGDTKIVTDRHRKTTVEHKD